MEQLEIIENSTKDLFDQILKVSSMIPTKLEIDSVINSFYDENKISQKTRDDFDKVFQLIGIDKMNQEGLDIYVSNIITKNTNLPIDTSSRIVHSAKNLIVDYLKREILQKKIDVLKSFNNSREDELLQEIKYLNQDINKRITKQKDTIEKYQLEISTDNLTTDQFIEATEDFLGIDLNRKETKIDVQRFLNGDNIIIEL